MTKVVGYSSEEDFRRAANVIRYVERGGIDHPYYRRQVPITDESAFDWLVTFSPGQFGGEDGEYTSGLAETTTTTNSAVKLCGNRSIANAVTPVVDDIVFTVDAARVTSWHECDPEDEEDLFDYPEEVGEFEKIINGKWYDKLIGPGELVLCQARTWKGPDGDRTFWMPIRGGATYFPFAVTKEDIEGEGQVYVYLPKDPLNHLKEETDAYEYAVWPPEADGYWKIEVRAMEPITGEVIPANTRVSLEWNAPSRKLIIRDIGCPFFDLGTGT